MLRHIFVQKKSSVARFCVQLVGMLCGGAFFTKVLYIESIIKTAIKILAKRGNDDAAHRAKHFLCNMGSESYLQLSLMADAAEEANQLLRAADQQVAVPNLIAHACDFHSRISFLFLEGGAWSISGFASFAEKQLQRQVTWVCGNKSFSLGGCSPELKARVMGRMQAWHRVAVEILKTEFPDFELVGSFQVFGFHGASGGMTPYYGGGLTSQVSDPEELHANTKQALQKLAQAFHFDYDALLRQFWRLQPVASHCKCAHHVSDGDAWKLAVQRSQKAWLKHDIRIIEACVRYFLAFAVGTTHLERKFAKQKRANHHSADGQLMDFDIVKAKLLTDYQECEEAKVISYAKKVWLSSFGPTRSSPSQTRVHKGLRQRKSGKSEASWLRARRQSLVKAVAGARLPGKTRVSKAALVAKGVWQESHEKEEQFQVKKRKIFMEECAAQGGLLASEVQGEADVQELETSGQHREDRRQKACVSKEKSVAKREAVNAVCPKTLLAGLKGACVFVDAAVASQVSTSLLAQRQLTMTSTRHVADLFVVQDPQWRNVVRLVSLRI